MSLCVAPASYQFPSNNVIILPPMDRAIASYSICDDDNQYTYFSFITLIANETILAHGFVHPTNFVEAESRGYSIGTTRFISQTDQACSEISIYVMNRPGLDLQMIRKLTFKCII